MNTSGARSLAQNVSAQAGQDKEGMRVLTTTHAAHALLTGGAGTKVGTAVQVGNGTHVRMRWCCGGSKVFTLTGFHQTQDNADTHHLLFVRATPARAKKAGGCDGVQI